MVQVLQAVLREASSEARTPFHTPGDLTGLALKRWYELDPEGALRELPILLAEPGIEFTSGAIASLPDNPQPQFEGSWARELLESRDEGRETVLAALLVRFGTGSALAQVEQKASTLGDVSGCAPQAAALAYLVKFNSMKAGSLLERALTEPHWQSCPANLFTMVSRFAQGPALNEAAIAAIQYPDTAVAADAAQYLRYFGMDSARGPLLKRYRRWSHERAAKPNESDPDSGPNAMFSELGQRLGEALIGGQGWLTDAALTEEVVKRCSGEMMCRQLKDLSDAAAAPALHVNVNHDPTEERYWIGPYSSKTRDLFEAKLDQFPKGTKFVLTPIWKNGNEVQIRTQTEELFKKHGMILEDPPDKIAATTR